MATLSGAERDNLSDSDFAYIEPGGHKDASGRTEPRSLRHFPIHDEAHVRAALSRIGQGAQFSEEARPKVMAKARSLGIHHDGADGDGDGDGRSWGDSGVERRFLGGHAKASWQISDYRLESRSADDGQHVGGYAAVFNSRSKNLGGFIEKIHRQAFNQAQLEGFPGAVCRYQHNEMRLLGTTQARTLRLTTDNVGLPYDVLLPQAESAVAELVARGDVAHSSFAFRCRKGGDEWGIDDTGYPERRLMDVELVDVAPVTTPAYADSSAGLRSLAVRFDADEAEVRSLAEENELRRFFVRTDNRGPGKPAKRLTGAQAMLQIMERRFSPDLDGI